MPFGAIGMEKPFPRSRPNVRRPNDDRRRVAMSSPVKTSRDDRAECALQRQSVRREAASNITSSRNLHERDYGPCRGRGLGTRFSFSFRWYNQVAWITVCEPLNAGLPPKNFYATSPHASRRRFLGLATVPVGAALETPAASNLRAPTRPMARAPTGNAKTHSTPSHDDGVEHKELLSPPPPPVTDTMVMQLW